MTQVLSADGILISSPYASLELRALAEFESTSLVASTAVAGFGGLQKVLFALTIASVSIVGGAGPPTARVEVYVQRTPDGGTTWDDLLALQTAALLHGAAQSVYLAEFNGLVTAGGTPAVVQDGGGSPPFAARGPNLTDSLRAKARLIVTGSPTNASVSWKLTALGRP
jgi:hypothetical protein